jgi:hypothetical protein
MVSLQFEAKLSRAPLDSYSSARGKHKDNGRLLRKRSGHYQLVMFLGWFLTLTIRLSAIYIDYQITSL